jgi:hypothetical protein
MLDGEADDSGGAEGFVDAQTTHGPPAIDVAREAAMADPSRAARLERQFVVTRDGVDRGPYTLGALERMAERGELRSYDKVLDRREQTPMLAVDVPELRVRFEAKIRKEEEQKEIERLRLRQPSGAAARVPRSSRGTLAWVVVALLAFAAAGWWLWRQQGGG